MKKKIISLVMAVIMTVGLLVSCGYSVAEDDMTQYATFDVAAFKAAIAGIVIEDGDFTTDEAVRAKKLQDAIFSSLTSLAEKAEEGTIAYRDTLYYCYYITFKDDDGNVTDATTVFANKMAVSAAGSLYGEEGAEADSIEAKIFKAVMDSFTFKKGDNFRAYTSTAPTTVRENDNIKVTYTETFTKKGETEPTVNKITEAVDVLVSSADAFSKNFIDKSTGKVSDFTVADEETEAGKKYTEVNINSVDTKAKAGDMVSVTYKEEYTKTGESKVTSTTYTNKIIVLDENDPLHAKFIGQKPGTVEISDSIPDAETTSGRKYSGVKLNWVKKEGTEFTVTNTTYDETYTATAVDGSTPDLKDKELTYHIFPVYFMDTPNELKWDMIFENFFYSSNGYSSSSAISSESLDCFENDATLKKLLDGDADASDDKLKTPFATLLNNKKSTESSTTATAEDKKEAKDLYDARFALIKSHIEGTTGLEAKIKTEFEEYTKEALIDNYHNEIKSNIAKELAEIIDKQVKLNGKLPEKLVDDVYYILMQNHKYDFYQGTTTVDSKTVTNYANNNGSFEKYLVSVFTKDGEGPKNLKEAEALVLEDAKEFVEYIVKLTIVAQALEKDNANLDVLLDDDEFEDMTYDDPMYYNYQSSYGDIGFRAAYQFEKLYNELLIIEGEQAAIDAYEAKVEAGDKEAEYDFDFDYKDNKVPFVHIKYTLA